MLLMVHVVSQSLHAIRVDGTDLVSRTSYHTIFALLIQCYTTTAAVVTMSLNK
jgi:hypothetical protein